MKNNECGKYRNIVFTLNNYTDQEFEDLKKKKLQPASGQPHHPSQTTT